MGRREEAELGPCLGDCGSALFYFFGGKILVFASYAWGWGGREKGLWVCNLGNGGGRAIDGSGHWSSLGVGLSLDVNSSVWWVRGIRLLPSRSDGLHIATHTLPFPLGGAVGMWTAAGLGDQADGARTRLALCKLS